MPNQLFTEIPTFGYHPNASTNNATKSKPKKFIERKKRV